MILNIEWVPMIPMQSRTPPVYLIDLERVPDEPGVYVFGRAWGRDFEALYVGKAANIRTRVKGQLNNLRLMQHLDSAKTGGRVVLPGAFLPRRGQQIDRCLPIIERALIRYFLLEGHDLVNIHGTRLRQHQVESSRRPRRFVPQTMFVDRSRG